MFTNFNIAKNLLAIGITVVIVYLVFFLHLDFNKNRILPQVWNLGHILLFIGIAYLLERKIFSKFVCSIFFEWFSILAISISLGLVIEYLQVLTGRDKSSYDVLLDLVGGMIGFILFSTKLHKLNSRTISMIRIVGTAFTLVAVSPAIIIIVDAVNQRKSFPILLENGSMLELSRIRKQQVKLGITRTSDKNMLNVTFMKDKYPTIGLKYFNNDWSEYKFLKTLIYNHQKEQLPIRIRLHDTIHRLNGFLFADRYRGEVKLEPGWNDVTIDLNKVKEAPAKRQMDMKSIEELMFFMVNVQSGLKLSFGKVWLEK